MYLTDEDLTPTETIISELLALRAVAPGNEAHQAEHAEAHGTLNEELAEIDNDARVAGLLVPNVTLPREVTFPQADLQQVQILPDGGPTERAALSSTRNPPGRVPARAALFIAINRGQGSHIYLIPQLPLHALSPYVSQVLNAVNEANPAAGQVLAAAGPGYPNMMFSTGSQPLHPLPSGHPHPDARPRELGIHALAARLRLHPVGESQAREDALRNAGISPQTALLILYLYPLGNVRAPSAQEEGLPTRNGAAQDVSHNDADYVVTPLTCT